MEKLECMELSNVCQCAAGYKYDSSKNDCLWVYYCDDGLIWDSVRHQCVKPSDFWLAGWPTSTHNPKLSFITFILLVFCFIKVMRSNSPYHSERRRRISTNLNRNSFDLLSTIINYENNQRYPIRNGQSTDRHGSSRSHHLRRDNEANGEFYDESLPPPAYEEIIRNDDLKTVTVEQQQNVGEEPAGDFELKELGQGAQLKLCNGPEESDLSSEAYANHNHIESSSGSSEPIGRSLVNGPATIEINQYNENASESSRQQLNRQPDENPQSGAPPDLSQQQEQRPLSQLNQSNEQLPTYEQAVRQNGSRNPPV